MRAKLLPATLINKGFVRGEQDCNYEIYLLELVNHSQWFCNRYSGGFTSPTSEANGECDAINEHYQLDFKLFAAETALRASNLLFPQITKMADGEIAYSGSRCSGQTFQANKLFAAFRRKSIDDMYQIRKQAKQKITVENVISSALQVLETKKNILLFFPYEFTFDVPHEYDDAIGSIREAIESDFHSAFLYRKKVAEGFDTFLTCIYDDSFLLFKVSSGGLDFCESIHSDLLPTYVKYKDLVDWD